MVCSTGFWLLRIMLPEPLLRLLHLTPSRADTMILLWYPPLKWLTINHPKFQPSKGWITGHVTDPSYFPSIFLTSSTLFWNIFCLFQISIITAWNGIHDHIQLMCESIAWISSSACLQNFYWRLISSWAGIIRCPACYQKYVAFMVKKAAQSLI